MKTSEKGIEFIKQFERLLLRPYICPAGLLTVGYGHVLRPSDKLHWIITEVEADKLLEKDVGTAANAVGRLIRVPLSQGQFDALVSFTFNLGSGALQRSTLRQKLNRGEYLDAADEFGRWVLAGGRKLPGLVRRRAAEQLIFQATNKGESK